MTVRVLLVEDHALVRAGFRALIEALPGVQVVGEAADGQAALRLVVELRPDLVLMDLSMPGLNGLETTRRVSSLRPRPRVLILSMHADREYVCQALAAGATGYILKTAERSELEMALSTVARGGGWLSPAIAPSVIQHMAVQRGGSEPHRPTSESLTPRQREVLQLIAEGHSTKEIARRLAISVKTVETHRAQIMERLGIHHVPGLVRFALRTGISCADA